MKTVPCAGCRAQIVWRMTPNDKLMPLNPVPVNPAQGTYVITSDEECRPSEPLMDGPDVKHYMNHWTTCPNAENFRKAAKRKETE